MGWGAGVAAGFAGLSSAAAGVADWRRAEREKTRMEEEKARLAAEATERKHQFDQTFGLEERKFGQELRRDAEAKAEAEKARRAEFRKTLAGVGGWRQVTAMDAGDDPAGFNYSDLIARGERERVQAAQETAAKLALLGAQTRKAQRPEEHALSPGTTLVRDGRVVLRTPTAPAKPDLTPFVAAPFGVVNTQTGGVRFVPQPVIYQDQAGNPQVFYPPQPGAKPSMARPPAEDKPDPAEKQIASEVGRFLREGAERGDPPEVTRALVRQYYQSINRPDLIPVSPLRQELEKALSGAVQAKKEVRPAPPKRKQNVKKPAPRRPQQSSMTPGAR